jgi:hypothetical protein
MIPVVGEKVHIIERKYFPEDHSDLPPIVVPEETLLETSGLCFTLCNSTESNFTSIPGRFQPFSQARC